LVESGVGSSTNEWMLVGVIGSHELGTPKRVMQLEKMKQRETDHGETYLAADVVCWPSKTFSVLLMLPASSSSLFCEHSGSY